MLLVRAIAVNRLRLLLRERLNWIRRIRILRTRLVLRVARLNWLRLGFLNMRMRCVGLRRRWE